MTAPRVSKRQHRDEGAAEAPRLIQSAADPRINPMSPEFQAALETRGVR